MMFPCSSPHRGVTTAAAVALVVIGAVLLVAGFYLGRASTVQVVPGDAVNAAPTSAPINAVPAAGPPPIVFDPPELDFGVVPPNTEMKGTIKIVNTGAKALTLIAMRPDCKCTTLEDLAGSTIAPGESLEVTAIVDGRSASGSKKSQIRFMFEGYEPTEVDIRSLVSLAVRAEPQYIIPTVQAQTGRFSVKSLDGSTFRVLSVNGATPIYTDDFDPSGAPRTEYRLMWDLTGFDLTDCLDADGNTMPGWVVVETDHPGAPLIDLMVRHNPCTLFQLTDIRDRGWTINPRRIVLGLLPAGEPVEFDVELKWRNGFRPNDTIRVVESESAQFECELVRNRQEGGKVICQLRVTPKGDARGFMMGTIRFYGYKPFSVPVAVIARVVDPVEQTASSH